MSDEKISYHRLPFYFRLMSRLVKSMLRLGIPVGPTVLLTVRGRKTGRLHTTPVGLFEREGHRYVYGTFGDGDWTRNLRAAGEAIVGRGWHRKKVSAVQIRDQREAALVLRDVLAPFLASRMGARMLRMGYNLTKDSGIDDYIREAKNHPGFELGDK